MSIAVTLRRPTVVQTNGTWGLNRISRQQWTYTSRDFPTNLTEYVYNSSGGSGTYVYVLDTVSGPSILIAT